MKLLAITGIKAGNKIYTPIPEKFLHAKKVLKTGLGF